MRKIYKVWLTLWTFAPISSDTTVNIHIQTYWDIFKNFFFFDQFIFLLIGSKCVNLQTLVQASKIKQTDNAAQFVHIQTKHTNILSDMEEICFFCVQWFHNHSTKWRCGCTSEEEEPQIQKAGSFPNVAAVTHIWVYFKHGKFPNWKNLTWERVSVASFTCPEEDSVSSRLVIFRALQCIQSPLLHSTEDTNIQY